MPKTNWDMIFPNLSEHHCVFTMAPGILSMDGHSSIWVLSELRQHLGAEPNICSSFRKKKGERDANVHELSLLRSIYDQETHQENRTGLCDLLLREHVDELLMKELVRHSTILRLPPMSFSWSCCGGCAINCVCVMWAECFYREALWLRMRRSGTGEVGLLPCLGTNFAQKG